MPRKLAFLFVLVAVLGSVAPSSSSAGTRHPRPLAVVALIDTGINPYSVAFRDSSPLAQQPPWTYIEGYPKDAKRLDLSLNLPYAKAVKKDAAVWGSVKRGELYWIPGTRIVGAISFEDGGTSCSPFEVPPANSVSSGCKDHLILDDHGHGTMTASRAAGNPHSLAPDARIVEIEGLGGQSVRWAADAGWIDVQSNSWVDLVPPPANGLFGGTEEAFAHAATRTFTLAASGNGTAFLAGVAPTPTYLLSTAPPGVVLVGGHDNGHVTLWAGAPPHVVADAYAGFSAIHDSSGPMRPDPIACCTSAASPYAAGGAVAIIEQARRILGDTTTGIHKGVVASGRAGLVAKGPLADGVFTLDELRAVFFHTAEAHPGKGKDDGIMHWMGDPRAPDYTQFGPGGNPFCIGCTTMPFRWVDVPDGGNAYPFVGYGGINERSVALAPKVLARKMSLPDRAAEDAQYEADQQIRAALFVGGDSRARLERSTR